MRTLVLLAALVGCDQTDFGDPSFGSDPPPGPGSPTWDDTDLSCTTNDECAPGEACDGTTCRPKQCDDGPYDSAAPLGPHRQLYKDEEILVVDADASQGKYWVDGYGAAGAIDYAGAGGGSYSIGTAQVVDVSRIDTEDGPGMVVASSGRTQVTITGAGLAPRAIDVGIVPVAVAAADVDGDALDDIVALSATAEVTVCSLAGSCGRWNVGNAIGLDIAAGDTDGDGIAELVILLDVAERTEVLAFNIVEDRTVGASFDTHFQAVTTGDLDRDGRAEVALLEDRGWLGFASDQVHTYRVMSQWTGIAATPTSGSAIDLAAGDVDSADGDGDVIAVLGSNRSVDVLRWSGAGLTRAYTGSVATTSTPRRIALGDVDQDSIAARLVSGPDLVPGGLVPMMAVTFPPYDASLAKGGVAGVAVGNRTDMSNDAATTVSLSAGIEVGVGADFLSVFSAKLSTKFSAEVSRTHSVGRKQSVGTKFSLRPQLDLYGDRYGAVVVGCNCFHTYVYELVDPANRAGGTGHRVTMIVPVGGQTTVLSTPRYNALAQAIGGLPEIAIPTTIGDPSSYPATPQKLDGSPVALDEQVFPNRPVLAVSDVSTVAFSLSVGSSETNSAALRQSVSVSGSLGALGVTVGGSLGVGWGESFSVSIGNASEFSGEVPPIFDDPSTPEDEYATHGFTYSPYVYRETYVDPVSNEPSGFYVIGYAVGAP